MLTLFRRHRKSCKFTTRKHRNCQCPIAVEGTLHGRMIRKSLDLRSWEAAQKLVRDWEANPVGTISVKEACKRFDQDAVARHLSDAWVRKLKNVTTELADNLGSVSLRSVTVDDIRKIRESWKLAPVTTQKRLEVLRVVFRFFMDSGWIERNLARSVRLPVVKQCPTLPFTEEEMEKILWAADAVRGIHPHLPEGIEKKLRALILLMRYSGIRISDAVTITKGRLKSGKLFLYQAKTDEPVWVPLPKRVLESLDEIDEGRAYYFWSGNGKLRHAPTEWQKRLRRVFDIAGLPDGHSHRFRDTFAVALLDKGIGLETVSILLGHSSISTTERHYAPWVKSRQIKLEEAVKAAFK